MFKYISTLVFLINFVNIFPQSLPIHLDGRYDDWTSEAVTLTDNENDGSFYDFKYVEVANDDKFIFFRLKVTPEYKLIEDNSISLFLDTDNNPSTGTPVNGIGAELRWDFGERDGVFYKNGTHSFDWPDIKFRALPSVTSTENEIAIGRDVKPDGTNFLFTSDTIKILFKDNASGGDLMPNSGEIFTYVFDNSPVTPYEPIEIIREDSSYLRIMNYNVLQDGLLDSQRRNHFERILQAVQPDIICFNEFFNSSAAQVRQVINEILPLPGGENWYAVKLNFGNVTVSKYPILQNWIVDPDERIVASLIDLPESFGRDILSLNGHLKCCGGQSNDDARQRQADAFVAFILDAKTPGGVIDLPEGTPFMLLGDMNLVGDRQQLETLLTGEIINVDEFGVGAPPDWDETNLTDMLGYQTDIAMAYTWFSESSSFTPGRLDFMIYSDSKINVEKDFVIHTELMPQNRLNEYGLLLNDTESASDHLPKVADITFIDSPASTEKDETLIKDFKLYQNYPNPFNPATTITYSIPDVISSEGRNLQVQLKIYDVLGNEIATLVNEQKQTGVYEVDWNATGIASGVYYYTLRAGKFVSSKKLLLLK